MMIRNPASGASGPGNSSGTDHGQYGSSEAKLRKLWQFTGQLAWPVSEKHVDI